MRVDASGNRVLLRCIEHRAVLVALVQSVVSPFHENPGPLHERGCEETGERANKDFLEEGRVHPFLTATMVPVSKLFAEDADPAIITIH